MEEFEIRESEFTLFRDLIYKLTGIALSDAKRQLVKSRLAKRLRHYGFQRYQQYYDYLIEQGMESPEITELVNCVTTNKTDFFRESHHFDFVRQTIVPELIQRAKRGQGSNTIRIWHAGCSTGEEPYTLGITLAEALEAHAGWDFRQLASDIDTNVLAHAERGVYDIDRVAPVPKALLHKYFLRGRGENADKVKVSRGLRDQITFRQINLLNDSWPIRNDTQFDIIFCRNVVIYFDKPTQKKLFARYQQLLRPGGYLFIGHSESLLGISDAFESLGHTIYRLPEHSLREAKAA